MIQPAEVALIQLIQSRRATSQIEIARSLGLPANTVHGMIKHLLEEGWIVQTARERIARGRPMHHYSIKSEGLVLAIEWEGTTWNVGVFGDKEICFSLTNMVMSDTSSALDQMRHLRDDLLKDTGINYQDLKGVVISLDGARSPIIDRQKCSVIPSITDLTAEVCEEIWKCSVLLTKIPCRALTETRARAREGCEKLCVLNVGDGVTAHGVTDAGPWASPQPFYGEIGRVWVDKRERLSGYAPSGYLETVIGGCHIVQMVREDIANGIRTSLSEVLNVSPTEFFARLENIAAKGKDPYAVILVDDLLDQCAWAVSLIMNLYNPDVVVLSGFVLEGRESWRRSILQKAAKRILDPDGKVVPLEFPRLKSSDRLESLVSEFAMAEAIREISRGNTTGYSIGRTH